MSNTKLLFLSSFVAALSCGSLSAAIVVSWGPSADYRVSSNAIIDPAVGTNATGDFGLGDSLLNDAVRFTTIAGAAIRTPAYDGTATPLSPNFFLGGAQYNPDTTSAPNIQGRLANSTPTDRISYNNQSSGSTHGVALVWWNSTNFVGAFQNNSADLAVGGSAYAQVNLAGARLMAQSGGNWYLSNTTSSAGALEIADLSSETWTLYNPGATHQSLWANGYAGAGSLTYASVTLDAVTALGVYYERVGTTANRNLTVSEFTIQAIPEPSTYAAILGMLVLGVVVLRRRR